MMTALRPEIFDERGGNVVNTEKISTSQCVLPNIINTTPRTPGSHSFCKFSCVNICKTMHPARSRSSCIPSSSSPSHQHKCRLYIK